MLGLKIKKKKPSRAKTKIVAYLIVSGVFLFFINCSNKHNIDLISKDTHDLKRLISEKPSTLQVDILNELAYRHSWDGVKVACKYAERAMATAKKIGYPRGIVDARCMLGQFYFLKGEFDKAQTWYKKGKELAEKIKYRTGTAMTYAGIGRYNQVRGEFARGLKNFLRSAEICKNSSEKLDKRVLAQTYYGIGALYYYDPKDYKEARNYFEKYYKLGEEIKDNIIITSGYYTIGEMNLNLHKYKIAKKFFNKCLDESTVIKLKYNIANAREGLGDVNVEQNEYNEKHNNEALEYYEESLKLFEEIDNKFQIAEIKRRLGKLFNKKGDNEKDSARKKECYEKAKKYLQKALEIANPEEALLPEIIGYLITLRFNNQIKEIVLPKVINWLDIIDNILPNWVNKIENILSKKMKLPKTIERACEEIVKSCEKLGELKEVSNYYNLLLETRTFLRDNEMTILQFRLDIEKNAQRDKIIKTALLIGLIGLFNVFVVVLKNSIQLRKQKAKIEVQTKQLEKALTKEKEISNHKDELMYTVSHQYKTPLSIIDSSTQILKEYLPHLSKMQIQEHFGKILSNLGKMTYLIDQLLMFGKKFNPGHYDLYQICKELTEEIKANEGAKHNIEFKSSVGCTKVRLDKDFMNIMLHNLVFNSIKYSPERSKISLELRCDEEYAAIIVADNGIGIPEEYLKMPFERFHRGSNVSAIPGTGLGLSIVKRYTDQHHGDIKIKSELNVGTTVTIRIPRDTES